MLEALAAELVDLRAERLVPRARLVGARGERDGALLVVGSSLTVMSGLRFVRRAASLGVPVVIANRGETRGDPLATYAVETGCSPFLSALEQRLSRRSPGEVGTG